MPCDSVMVLEGFCQRLEENPELSKKMIYYLSFLGGYSTGNRVRRMMTKLGTKRLWSDYRLKGRKEACLKNNGETKANEIEEAILETRKYVPNQHGGIKYKVPEQNKKR